MQKNTLSIITILLSILLLASATYIIYSAYASPVKSYESNEQLDESQTESQVKIKKDNTMLRKFFWWVGVIFLFLLSAGSTILVIFQYEDDMEQKQRLVWYILMTITIILWILWLSSIGFFSLLINAFSLLFVGLKYVLIWAVAIILISIQFIFNITPLIRKSRSYQNVDNILKFGDLDIDDKSVDVSFDQNVDNIFKVGYRRSDILFISIIFCILTISTCIYIKIKIVNFVWYNYYIVIIIFDLFFGLFILFVNYCKEKKKLNNMVENILKSSDYIDTLDSNSKDNFFYKKHKVKIDNKVNTKKEQLQKQSNNKSKEALKKKHNELEKETETKTIFHEKSHKTEKIQNNFDILKNIIIDFSKDKSLKNENLIDYMAEVENILNEILNIDILFSKKDKYFLKRQKNYFKLTISNIRKKNDKQYWQDIKMRRSCILNLFDELFSKK